jgi:hypothetical protein
MTLPISNIGAVFVLPPMAASNPSSFPFSSTLAPFPSWQFWQNKEEEVKSHRSPVVPCRPSNLLGGTLLCQADRAEVGPKKETGWDGTTRNPTNDTDVYKDLFDQFSYRRWQLQIRNANAQEF